MPQPNDPVAEEATHDSIFVGADAQQPEDLEADEILPGEEGYQDPAAEPEAETEPEPQPDPEPKPEDGGGEPEPETPEEGSEAEETQEEDGEPEPEEQPQNLTPQTIPKARLDKALRDKRQLEARIQQLEAAQQTPTEPQTQPQQEPKSDQPDNAEAEQKAFLAALNKAFVDGDMNTLGKLMTEREEATKQQVRQEVLASVQKEVPQRVEQNQKEQAFNAVRVDLETKFEFLDPNSDTYDEGVVDTISTFIQSYVNQGYEPADALSEATDRVLRVEKPELFVEPKAEKTTTAEKAEAVRKQRLNIDQKLKAAQQQPPAVESSDVDAIPIPDFEEMSEAEFDKLSDKELDDYLKKIKAQR